MEKSCCQVNVVEKDDGYRLELRGEKAAVKAAWAARSRPSAVT